MLTNGYHDVPPGKLAVVVTYLEMTEEPDLPDVAFPEELRVTHVSNPEVPWYRDMFLRVGGYEWLWSSRLRLCDADLHKAIQHEATQLFVVTQNGCAEGFAELHFDTEQGCELAFFGLTPKLIGRGIGRALVTYAIRKAWSRPIRKLRLQTCTADSPQALGFYRAHGFSPVQQKVEIFDDPRLDGTLPPASGAHMPIFGEKGTN